MWGPGVCLGLGEDVKWATSPGKTSQGEQQKESNHAVAEKRKDSAGDGCWWCFDLRLLDEGKIVRTIYDTNHA